MEIIVIDDASQDGTADWLAETFPNCRLIALPVNRGAAEARNEGLRVASGEFIAFLDDDDRWEPEFLSSQIGHLRSHSQTVLSFSDYAHELDDGRIVECDLRPSLHYETLTEHFLTEFFVHSMSLVVIRRKALEKVGLLDPELRVTHDCELYLRLLFLGHFHHLAENLVLREAPADSLVANLAFWENEERALLKQLISRTHSSQFQSRIFTYRALFFAKVSWDKRYDLKFTSKMLARALVTSPRWFLQIILRKSYHRLSDFLGLESPAPKFLPNKAEKVHDLPNQEQ